LEALGINLGYLVGQLFNFTLLAILLYVVAYKPVMRMLDQRSARIQKGLEDAELAAKRAAETEQEFQRQLAQARKEGQEIIAQATHASDRVRQEILDKAHEDARAMVDKAKEEIDRERTQAMSDLRREVGDLSVSIAQKIIGQSLDEQSQRRLIAEFLDQTEDLK
jgi:F-type H+-transporting ATPase subunit b